MIEYKAYRSLREINQFLVSKPILSDPLKSRWLICQNSSFSKKIIDDLTEETGYFAQYQMVSLEKLNDLIFEKIDIYPKTPSIHQLTWRLIEGYQDLINLPRHGDFFKKIFGKINPLEKTTALSSRQFISAQRLAQSLIKIIEKRPHWLQIWGVGTANQNVQALSNHPLYQKITCHLQKYQAPFPKNCPEDFWKQLCHCIFPRFDFDAFQFERALLALIENQSCLKDEGVEEVIFVAAQQISLKALATLEILSECMSVQILALTPIPTLATSIIEQPPSQAFNPIQLKEELLSQSIQNAFNRNLIEQALDLPLVLKGQIKALAPTIAVSVSDKSANDLALSKGLLQQLQHILAEDKAPSLEPIRAHLPINISLHGCHHSARQIEVLYDELCALFRQNPSLRPRDILVLCTDIENQLPLIQAVFNGQNERLGACIERVNAKNLGIELLEKLIRLSNSRLYRYDVFEIIKQSGVTECFHLSLEEILELENLIKQSGVRWGLDEAHRLSLGLNAEDQHTWQYGLDRLLFGMMSGSDQALFENKILSKTTDQPKALIKFFEFYEQLQFALTHLKKPQSATQWYKALSHILEMMIIKEEPYLTKLQKAKQALYDALTVHQGDYLFTPAMILGLFQNGLGQEYQLINAGKDQILFSPIEKANSLSYPVVCMIGMEDGIYPKTSFKGTHQLNPVAQSAQLFDNDDLPVQSLYFANAIHQAQHALLIFFNAYHSDLSPMTPSVFIQFLEQELKHRFLGPNGEELLDILLKKHSLHAFSPSNFKASTDGIADQQTISHERLWLEGAKAWRESQINPIAPRTFVLNPLDELSKKPNTLIRIDQLIDLLKRPSEFFLKKGVGLSLMKDEVIRRERELLELDQLQNWMVKDRLLQIYQEKQLDQIDHINREYKYLYQLLQADNLLPIGNMGKIVFEQAFEQSRVLHQKYCDIKEGAPQKQGYGYVRIDEQTELRLDLSEVFGNRYVSNTASALTKKDEYKGDKLLKPWIYHVALCAQQAQSPYDGAFLVGDDRVFSDFPMLSPDQAKGLLSQWKTKLKEGNLSPLRFDPDFSLTYLNWKRIPQPIKELEDQWKNSYASPDLYLEQAFEGSHLWQCEEQGVHPDFDSNAFDIFGALDDRIYQKKLAASKR